MEIVAYRGKNKNDVEVEENGVTGVLSVNGMVLGDTLESETRRVTAGQYRGIMRYVSGHELVQGPLGRIASDGDFLLELSGVTGPTGTLRTGILLHQGNKPWHSEGCILAGPVTKKKVGDKWIASVSSDTTLRALRKAFYGTDGVPVTCPSKIIRIKIADIVRN
jgi:hypothetical protein